MRRPFPKASFSDFDPFLLLDEMGPMDVAPGEAKGAPDHPHRGFETVTYILSGDMEHKDSSGHAGQLRSGDVQWMTAGSGVVHAEMPSAEFMRTGGRMHGFQLWVNLPQRYKMIKPRYQEIRSVEIPEIKKEHGEKIRVISGTVAGVPGPVTDIAANPVYLDVSIPAHTSFRQPIERGHAAFAYVFEGEAKFAGRENEDATKVTHPKLVVLGDGDYVQVATDETPVRFLLVSGKPLHEPVARYGPFVMNTEEEIEQTLQELQQGTFVTT